MTQPTDKTQTIRIQHLTALDEANAVWTMLQEKFPNSARDYYFFPDYVWLNEFAEKDGHAMILCAQAQDGFAWYPVIIRPLPNVFGFDKFDATSPYGFGGPLVTASNSTQKDALLHALSQAWQTYGETQNVIAEFCRFHPLLENQKDAGWLEAHQVKEVAYFDLTVDEGTLYERLHSQKRRSLKKADKSNLSFSDNMEHYPAFRNLYHASMAGKNADSFYHFSPEFFDRIQTLAEKTPEHIRLHSVLHEGTVISSAIFFRGGDTVEYFLGANAPEARDVHSSAWLLWQTALKSKADGFQRYVLGGGLKADDELFRFKQQLSPLTAPYFIGRKIINPEAYGQVRETYHRQWPSQSDNASGTTPIFFYRHNG